MRFGPHILRAPEGAPPGGGNPPPAATPAAGNPPPGTPPAMPEGLPAQFWDQQTGQVNITEFVKAHNELATFKTEHDARVATLPQKPEDYKIAVKLPPDVQLPEGVKPEDIKIDEKDPRIPVVRAFALKHRLPQDAVDELVALDAQQQIAALKAADAEMQAEMKKLGENGKERVAAAESYLKANVSQEEYEALRPVIANASAFSAVEKLIKKAAASPIPGNPPPANSNVPPSNVRPADILYGQKKAS